MVKQCAVASAPKKLWRLQVNRVYYYCYAILGTLGAVICGVHFGRVVEALHISERLTSIESVNC